MFARCAAIAAALRPAQAVRTDDFMLEALNKFNSEMQDFTAKLRGHVYSEKQAARLSKLWRDVEASGEWPNTSRGA
jgi:hypothetical protein